MICGGGVRYSEAAEQLKQFAETFQIPFAETQAGKSAVVSEHVLNVGGVGENGLFSSQPVGERGRSDYRYRHTLHGFHHLFKMDLPTSECEIPKHQHCPF